MFLFPLNNTTSAVPLSVNKPLISEDKFIALFKYNSVNIKLAPQLGISPIKLDINGPNIVSFRNIFDKKPSPTYVNNVFIINVITNMNNVMFIVCFNAGFNIPCSQ